MRINVEFDFDKSVIKPQYNDEIKRAADFLKQYPGTHAVIAGHTDNIGTHEYNIKLSQHRAEAVMKYMVEKFGIEANRLTAEGFAFDKPIATNKTKEGRAENRRVEAVFKAEEKCKNK